MAELAYTVARPPAGGIWRVAPEGRETEWRSPAPMTTDQPGAGNRFDSIAGSFGTLYCGTTQETCFTETLARFRPDPALRRLVADEWDQNNWMRTGNVPRSWRDKRRLVQVSTPAEASFLDVESAQTRRFLEEQLHVPLTFFGVDHLDVPVIRGGDRRITRMISQWAYTYQIEDGSHPFSGIRYLSKVDTDLECWALFQGTGLVVRNRLKIERGNYALTRVAHNLGLTVH